MDGIGSAFKMRRMTLMLFLSMLLSLHVSASQASDGMQNGMVTEIRNAALMAGSTRDFAKLEKMAEGYRTGDERLPDGSTKLEAFYQTPSILFQGTDRDEMFEQWEKIFSDWKAAFPGSKTMTIMHASTLNSYAWSIRGTGYSEKVWKEDWKDFEKLNERASQMLLDNKDAASADPRWYALLIKIRGGVIGNSDELWSLAREGVAKNPRSFGTYINMMNFLMPQWGGSAASMKQWADEAVEVSKSSEGESVYARLYWYLFNSMKFENFQTVVDWPRLKKATDDLLDRYPSVGNIETALTLACKSGDPDEVTKRYARLATIAGPRMKPTIVPAEYCRWPQPVVNSSQQPGVVRPDDLRSDQPKKTNQ